jgi:hypothetical protein
MGTECDDAKLSVVTLLISGSCTRECTKQSEQQKRRPACHHSVLPKVDSDQRFSSSLLVAENETKNAEASQILPNFGDKFP